MPTYYQFEHPDYGWLTVDFEALIEEFKDEVNANSLFEDEFEFKVRIVEMTQEEFKALPLTED